jgi:ubiquinone/menaquinone biosynthesis C-methylase UbiE
MTYVKANGRFGFNGFYDRSIAITMREQRWRPLLAERLLAQVPQNGTVVDLGAGTGTLAIALAGARPDVRVIGIDGDPEILEQARAKAGAEKVEWQTGLAGKLDLHTDSVDGAVMSLVLHHLAPATKNEALSDVRRILRPGCELHVADWGKPATPLGRAAFAALQVIDGFENTRDHAQGRLPQFLSDAGFANVTVYRRLPTGWGTLELLAATAL